MDFNFVQDTVLKLLNASVLIVFILQECEAASSAQHGSQCSRDGVFVAREGDVRHCSTKYLRCEDAAWIRAMCVGGYFNTTMKECAPFGPGCQQNSIDIDDKSLPLVRHKRQTSTQNDCSESYLCPRDVIEEFIYPDWDNRACDTFFKCSRGILKRFSCKSGIYKYYNPRTFSCEEQPSATNTCLKRLRTRLGPILTN